MNSAVRKIDEGEHHLIARIGAGDESAFEKLFFDYYSDLCSAAFKVTSSREGARDVVQEVFLRLWEKRGSLKIKVSLRAYLYKAVWNQALNYSKKKKNRLKTKRDYFQETDERTAPETEGGPHRLQKVVPQIWKIVQTMPKYRKFVFTLHRKDGLSYKEIAQVMGIRRKTVENHLGLALKDIRDKMDIQL